MLHTQVDFFILTVWCKLPWLVTFHFGWWGHWYWNKEAIHLIGHIQRNLLTQFSTLTPHTHTMVDELWLFWCTRSSFSFIVYWHFGPKIIVETTSELITVKCSLQAICKWWSFTTLSGCLLLLLFIWCIMQQEHWYIAWEWGYQATGYCWPSIALSLIVVYSM